VVLSLATALLRGQKAEPTPEETVHGLLPSPLWAEHAAMLKPYTLVEGFVTQEPVEVSAYISLAQESFVKTICETGFNGGQSSLLWLLANPQAKLYSFDLADYEYTRVAGEWMKKKFPDRFTLTAGNSVVTVPAFAEARPDVKCDLIVVDGGHDEVVAKADVAHFAALAAPVNRVVVDDTPCAVTWCMGPNSAWADALKTNLVSQIRSVNMGAYRGFVVGEYVPKVSASGKNTVPAPSGVAKVPMLDSVSLCKKLPPATFAYAINLGAGDGIYGMPGVATVDPRLLDPTYPLFTQYNFAGVAIEGNPNYLPELEKNLPSQNVAKEISMITPLNVHALLKAGNAPMEPTYFKNDIDGYDCAVDWAVLRAGYRPKLLQLEVNPEVPWPVAFGVQYSDKFVPKLGLAGFYGCSLKLTDSLVSAFGYELVGVGDTHDAFWARSDLREQMGMPKVDGYAASKQLLGCCNPSQFGLGVAEAWSIAADELEPHELVARLKPSMEQSCKVSQGTQACEVPYTLSLDGMDYVANGPEDGK